MVIFCLFWRNCQNFNLLPPPSTPPPHPPKKTPLKFFEISFLISSMYVVSKSAFTDLSGWVDQTPDFFSMIQVKHGLTSGRKPLNQFLIASWPVVSYIYCDAYFKILHISLTLWYTPYRPVLVITISWDYRASKY